MSGEEARARLLSASCATVAAAAEGVSPRRCAASTTPASSSGNTLSQTPSVAATTTSPAATSTVLSCAAADTLSSVSCTLTLYGKFGSELGWWPSTALPAARPVTAAQHEHCCLMACTLQVSAILTRYECASLAHAQLSLSWVKPTPEGSARRRRRACRSASRASPAGRAS